MVELLEDGLIVFHSGNFDVKDTLLNQIRKKVGEADKRVAMVLTLEQHWQKTLF